MAFEWDTRRNFFQKVNGESFPPRARALLRRGFRYGSAQAFCTALTASSAMARYVVHLPPMMLIKPPCRIDFDLHGRGPFSLCSRDSPR